MADIIKVIQNNAVIFGNEANLNRAFPSVFDGLKPSQRASLWTAYINKYFSSKPHVKSAKLDGATIASFHPHASVYETFARLSQPFIMNIPLIDFHGGNGTQLGSADVAASRYTEVRLSEAAEDGYFSNIKKDTCQMQLNFSEDMEWPVTFPALIPNLFVNGSDGIGYGFSQTWQPGNLNEFTEAVINYIKTNKIDISNIYPDYPTRGIIINKSEIAAAYNSGKGNVILRGKAKIDGNIIRITELPYQVYLLEFKEQLKKLITPDSKNIVKIPGVEDIFDMSGEHGMLLEIECNDNPEIVLNMLYKYTDLQVVLPINQYAIIDGIPELITLPDYIKLYVQHNIDVIIKEFTFDKTKAADRLEIVAGLLKAIDEIDSIISIIKASKTLDIAKSTLISNGYTEAQAKAIIDMRLGKLSGLETKELLAEQKELLQTIKKCDAILSSKKKQQDLLIDRLSQFTEKYGWERRTVVTDIDFNYQAEMKVQRAKIKSTPVQYSVIYDAENNTIRKFKLGDFRLPRNSHLSEIITDSKDYVVFITNKGTQYKYKVKDLALSATKAIGENVDTLLKLTDEHVIACFQNKLADKYLVFFTNTGLVKKIETNITLCISKNAATQVMKLKDDETIINVLLATDDTIFTVKSNNGSKEKERIIKCTDLIAKGRSAGGVNAVKLGKNYKIASITSK